MSSQSCETEPLRNPLIPSTPEEIRKRREEALVSMRHAFLLMLVAFGEEEGRRRWEKVPKKRRGREKGSTKPQENGELLKLHDRFISMGENPKRLPGLMGKTFGGNKNWPLIGVTTSPGALTKRIRGLLKKREDRAIGNPLNWREK